jgi:nicotinamidase-related amidase
MSSDSCELLLAFEEADSLQELAARIGRDLSVVSRQLQRLAEDHPVLEKVKGRWRLTPLGHQVNAWSRGALATQERIFEQYRRSEAPPLSAPVLSPRSVLLLINVQEGFDDPKWGIRNNLEAEPNMARILARWRGTGRAVVFVQHQSVEPKSPLRSRTRATQIKGVVRPLPSETVVEKSRNSAFADTELGRVLQDLRCDSLVFVGIPLDHCVDASIRSASDLGFRCFVVADATVSFERVGHDGAAVGADDIHRAVLAGLNQEFATVVTTGAVLAQLEEEAPPR